MFDRIVLAVDGSPSSDVAVETAISVASKMRAEVEVVHVREHEGGIGRARSGFDLETGGEAVALLSDVAERLTKAGITAHTTLRQAPAHEVSAEIIRVADEVGGDMIVVGSRGLSAFSGMLVGSVSSKLVHHSGRPVLVTREGAASLEQPPALAATAQP